MTYSTIIKDFFKSPQNRDLDNFFESMYCLVGKLKQNGLTIDTMNEEIVRETAKNMLHPDTHDFLTVNFEHYLIYYFKFLLDLDYDYEQTNKFIEIINEKQPVEATNDCDDPIDCLQPSDFQDKQYVIGIDYMIHPDMWCEVIG